jgi:hypothetical protein
MDNSFCSEFLANFLSDLIVGAILGTLLALWIGRKIGEFERTQQRKAERKAQLEKTIRYLELLKEEVSILLTDVRKYFDRLSVEVDLVNTAAMMATGFWEVLQPSGELPRLLLPKLLADLTRFYQGIAFAQRGYDLVMETWSDPQCEPASGVILLILRGFERARDFGRDLPDTLDREIQALKIELESQ